MKKVFISSAYIYPVCPLNINHTKMFIIADIIARYSRLKNKNVFFPIASHYSGNTAQRVSKSLKKVLLDKEKASDQDRALFYMYKNYYKTSKEELKKFTKAINILDFYNKETLDELKTLGVSGDYKCSYTTEHKDFSVFINTLISFYEKNNLIKKNRNGKLSLTYENEKWRKNALELVRRTKFIQSFHMNNVISAMKNVRNDWGLLKKAGTGTVYKKQIIDPMFDSELLTIFDLYIKIKKEYPNKTIKPSSFFMNLFKTLGNGKDSKDLMIRDLTKWLPCDIFICEEHLKNWIVKKMFTESLLLNKKYQTKKYFVLGMGLLDGKRMSASRGSAILSKDLIEQYGPIKARLIIIMQGGHPSKAYKYDESLIAQINRMLKSFERYYISLYTLTPCRNPEKSQEMFKQIFKNLDANIENGYFRQAIIELFLIIPKKYNTKNQNSTHDLINLYKKYLEILLPGLLKDIENRNKEILKN